MYLLRKPSVTYSWAREFRRGLYFDTTVNFCEQEGETFIYKTTKFIVCNLDCNCHSCTTFPVLMSTSRGKITVNSRSTWSTARARCTRRREQKATSNGAGIVCTNCGAEFLMGAIKSQASEVLGTRVMYRDRLKGLYVVARNFFLLLLNCSDCPCLALA